MLPRAWCLVVLFLLVGLQTALAQEPKTVFLQELTWTELRDLIRSGKTTIIIPVGGTEQSGPYVALGKHNVRVRALSEKIALDLGNALVAPVVAYVPEGNISPPTGHMGFPGTITIPVTTFEHLLESAARSFKHAGFRDVVLLGDHGGYQTELRVVAERLNREWAGTAVRAHYVQEYYRVTETDYVQALRHRGYSEQEIGTHAGLSDTSLMLAVDPRMVRIDSLRAGPNPGRGNGVYGDPRRATAALGQIGVNLIIARTVEAIRKDVSRR